jgi:hypothetical protein
MTKKKEKTKKLHLRGIWWWDSLCCTWNVFSQTNAIQNIHIGFCREFNGLSKYAITFLKMFFYDNDIPKIQCLTYFFQAYISYKTHVSLLQCIELTSGSCAVRYFGLSRLLFETSYFDNWTCQNYAEENSRLRQSS